MGEITWKLCVCYVISHEVCIQSCGFFRSLASRNMNDLYAKENASPKSGLECSNDRLTTFDKKVLL